MIKKQQKEHLFCFDVISNTHTVISQGASSGYANLVTNQLAHRESIKLALTEFGVMK